MAKKVISQEKVTPSPSADLFTPDLGGSNDHVRALPTVNLKNDALKIAPFVLWFHPKRWTVIAGSVVPHLQEFRLIPGVDNYTVGVDGKPKISKLKVQKLEADWIMVEYRWAEGGSYIKKVSARMEGSNETAEIYLPIWCTPISGSSKLKINDKAYAAWLLSLMDQGHLPKPDAYIAEDKLAQLKSIINGYKKNKLEVPSVYLSAKEAWEKLAKSGEEILSSEAFQPSFDEE
jgi:hypothetical protein